MDFVDLLGDGDLDNLDENGVIVDGGEESADLFMFGMNATETQQVKSLKDSVIFLIDCH